MRRNYCRKCGEEIEPHEAMIDGMHEMCYREIEGKIEAELLRMAGMEEEGVK